MCACSEAFVVERIVCVSSLSYDYIAFLRVRMDVHSFLIMLFKEICEKSIWAAGMLLNGIYL